MEPVVDDLLHALQERNWETARLALHPYLHWELEDGTMLKGRNQVLAMLARAPRPDPPSAVELRDEQIYRWQR